MAILKQGTRRSSVARRRCRLAVSSGAGKAIDIRHISRCGCDPLIRARDDFIEFPGCRRRQ